MNVKEAIVLAGGFGTRLRPLTYTRPKPLLPVLNKPIISYIINQLPREVERVIIASNYRNDMLRKFFKENDFGREIIINKEDKPLGTGGAVKFAEKYISDHFFVLNADIISSLDLNMMKSFHEKRGGFATISLWPVENVEEFGVVEIKDGIIRKFIEKPRQEEAPSNLINAGAYLLSPEVLNYIEINGMVSMEKEIFPKIINNGKRFLGFNVNDYWIDVGRVDSYIKAHCLLMKKNGIKNVVGENSLVEGKLVNSAIGNDVIIGKGSEIVNSVVFDGAIIKDGVKIMNSIVGEKCYIEPNSKVKNSVVGDEEIIHESSIIENKRIWTKEIPKGYPNKQIGNEVRK
ncbi:MAG: NDP-sugar synthase [Candidatus Aenigmarchaeota archaeon]|nr:NDP-sugar synthase [Candidatus Aenigmarchaeota archaeon]